MRERVLELIIMVADFPHALAIFPSSDKLGPLRKSSRSRREMVEGEVKLSSANCAWVKPASSRSDLH